MAHDVTAMSIDTSTKRERVNAQTHALACASGLYGSRDCRRANGLPAMARNGEMCNDG